MLNHSSNTAILVFIRSVADELANKRLFPAAGYQGNVSLIRSLNKQVRNTVQATGLPYFVIDSTSQKGDNFGERLTNAMASVFIKGFERVVVIGNDCLSIDSSLLLNHVVFLAAYQNEKIILWLYNIYLDSNI